MPGHEDAGPTGGKKSAEQQGSGRGRSGTEDISAAWRCGAGALRKELRVPGFCYAFAGRRRGWEDQILDKLGTFRTEVWGKH